MNGRTLRQVARSVQLAVMTAPETTILEAAVEARRRHWSDSAWIQVSVTTPLVRMSPVTA